MSSGGTEEEDSFQRLPNEIVVHIFSFLDLLDTGSRGLPLVSKRFRDLCLDASLWTRLVLPPDRLDSAAANRLLVKHSSYLTELNLGQRYEDGAQLAAAAVENSPKLRKLTLHLPRCQLWTLLTSTSSSSLTCLHVDVHTGVYEGETTLRGFPNLAEIYMRRCPCEEDDAYVFTDTDDGTDTDDDDDDDDDDEAEEEEEEEKDEEEEEEEEEEGDEDDNGDNDDENDADDEDGRHDDPVLVAIGANFPRIQVVKIHEFYSGGGLDHFPDTTKDTLKTLQVVKGHVFYSNSGLDHFLDTNKDNTLRSSDRVCKVEWPLENL